MYYLLTYYLFLSFPLTWQQKIVEWIIHDDADLPPLTKQIGKCLGEFFLRERLDLGSNLYLLNVITNCLLYNL